MFTEKIFYTIIILFILTMHTTQNVLASATDGEQEWDEHRQPQDKRKKFEIDIQKLGKDGAHALQILGEQHPNYKTTKRYYTLKINHLQKLLDIESKKSLLRSPHDQTILEDSELENQLLEEKWRLNEQKRKDQAIIYQNEINARRRAALDAANLLHPEDRTVSESDDDK